MQRLAQEETGAIRLPQSGPRTSQPAQSANAANATLGRMYQQAANPPGPAVRARLEQARTALVRAATDRDIDLAKYQQQGARAKGAPLTADEMLYEIKRLNPDKAAEVKLQEGLRPAIQSAGDDLPWLSVYLTHQDNLDVAKAMGKKVEREALKADLPGMATSDLQREQARLRALRDMRTAYTNVPDRLQIVDEQIAEAGRRVATLQRKVKRQESVRASNAAETGLEARAHRHFSGNLAYSDSMVALKEMETELGPQRFQTVQQAAQQVAAFGHSTLLGLKERGVIGEALYNELVREYPSYVPTRILDYMAEPTNVANGKSLSVTDSGLRRNTIEGTVRAREDPLASMVRYAYQAEAIGRKNEAFNAFLNLRDLDPHLQATIKKVPDSYTATRNEAKVTGFVKGVRETYVVPKELEAVIKGEPGAVIPGFAGAVWGTMMGTFRAMATSRNPLFLASNATLDAATYAVRESMRAGGPQALPKVLAELAGAYADAFRGVLQDTYHGSTAEFLKGGGGMFGFFQGTPGEARATVQSLARSNVFTVNTAGDLKRLALDMASLKPVEGIGERIELAPRVASFRLAQNARANPVKAVINGRTVTMDFAQGGNVSKVINQFVPFFNVGMQAPAQLVRAFRENPKGFIATAVTLLAGPTLVAEAWNRADPQRATDYDDVPQYLKDQGIVVMLPGQAPVDARGNRHPQFVHIRLREFAPFAIVAREAVQRAVGDDSREWGSLLGGLASSVSPVQGNNPADVLSSFTPLGVSTGLQLASNQDYFRGRMIATKGGDERATETSKVIAKALAVRPSQVEFTVRDLGAGVGGAALAAGELAAGKQGQTGGLQGAPVVGGVYGRFVKGNIGDRLDRARQRLLTPEGKRILQSAGVDMPLQPVGNTISSVPLNMAEEERYQVLVNRYTDEAIKRAAALSAWGRWTPDQRDDVVRGLVDGGRDRAGAEVLRSLGGLEIKRRLQ